MLPTSLPSLVVHDSRKELYRPALQRASTEADCSIAEFGCGEMMISRRSRGKLTMIPGKIRRKLEDLRVVLLQGESTRSGCALAPGWLGRMRIARLGFGEGAGMDVVVI